jgi:cobalt-zinc-cadmium efflux system outer membrane protein
MATAMLAGCAATRCAPGRSQVDAELQARAADGLGPATCGESLLPDDVLLDDGLTADEAVAAALWNNSAFNATLAQLGMVRGDLVQAGLLRNPQFQLFFPGGTKQLEWTLYLPLETFLLRETRLDMSEREVRRVAETLVQNGLDVVRDTRVAHADLTFAVDRAALANEAVDVRQRIADLTKKQLDAGDISELEATTARIDLLRAQADAAGLQHAVAQAEARLKQLMSIGTWSTSLQPIADEPHSNVANYELQALIDEATTCRPDLRSASYALEAAKKRADLSRWQWLRFDGIADANSGGAGNSNIGPGFRLDIPIFDRNQGGIITADWSVNQAMENYNTVRDQVVMEVQTAYSQSQQATDNLAILRSDVLTSLQEAVDLAGKAYADGGAPYFLVLQTTSQFLDSRTQELQLVADLRRANANLDRSVGRRLSQKTGVESSETDISLPVTSLDTGLAPPDLPPTEWRE